VIHQRAVRINRQTSRTAAASSRRVPANRAPFGIHASSRWNPPSAPAALATNAPTRSESDVVNANATAILRACSVASAVGGVAGVEVAAATPEVATEPSVTSTAINNVANAQANRPCAVSRKKSPQCGCQPISFEGAQPNIRRKPTIAIG
jgi:hypothetical protein